MTLNANWDKVGGEARTEEYRTWRTNLGFGAVGDLDQVEYDAATGRPRAFLELCVADMKDEAHPAGVREGGDPSPRFFAAVEAKVAVTRPQGTMIRYIAGQLKVPVYLVVYIFGHLDRLWLKEVGTIKEWRCFTTEQFREGLQTLYKRPLGG
jgi:hypothetical protein